MRRLGTGPVLAGVGIGDGAALLRRHGRGPARPCASRSKPFPALALAAWVALRCPRPLGRLTAAGLVLSALGDVLLETGLFLPGLLAFLSAHLAYVAAFLSAERRRPSAAPFRSSRWGLGAFAILRPGLGADGPARRRLRRGDLHHDVAGGRAGRQPGHARPGRRRSASPAPSPSERATRSSRSTASPRPIPGVRWPIMILYWLGQSGIAASAVLGCGMLRAQVKTR